MPRLTITLPPELVQAVSARTGRGEVSAWIGEAIAERLSREGLADAVADYEAENGPITSEDIEAAKARTAWKPPRRRGSSPAA